MKLLRNIINVTVWSLLALYSLVVILIHIPAVQCYLGRSVASAVSEKLDTEVSISRVDIGLFNRVILDDVLLLDQHDKPMLKASRLTAKVSLLPLLRGRIVVSSAQIFGAHASFYRRDGRSPVNFQFVLDSLASKDSTSHTPLYVRINSLIISHSTVTFDQYDKPQTPGRFNASHLDISDLSAYLSLKVLTDDSLNLNVKRLSLSEQSGLDVSKLSFALSANRRALLLSDFTLDLPSSHVRIDSLSSAYTFSGDKPVMSVQRLEGRLDESSYVTPSDLRCFSSWLKNFQRRLTVSSTFSLSPHHAKISDLNIMSDARDVKLLASASVGYGEKSSAWLVDIKEAQLSENVIDLLQKNIDGIPRMVSRLGGLRASGTASRSQNGLLQLHGNVTAAIGQAEAAFSMSADRQFNGRIETSGIDLGQLTGNDLLGRLVGNVALSGLLPSSGSAELTATGTVSELGFNGYRFTDITLNGKYSADEIGGLLLIDDDNLRTRLEGSLAISGELKTVKIKGSIDHFRPDAINLTDRWGEAAFATNIDADFSATNVNDARGTARLSSLRMMPEDGRQPYFLDNLQLTSGYDGNLHYVRLISDFARLSLHGMFDYKTIAQSIVNFVGAKLPTLPGLPPTTMQTDNDFSLQLQVFKTDWLHHLLGVDATLSHPLTLTAHVNDRSRDVFIDAELPAFTYNGAAYSDGKLLLTSPADTMRCDLNVKKLMDNGHGLSLGLQVKAIDNRLRASLSWDNHEEAERMSGEFNSIVELYHNLQSKPEAHIRVQPSHVVLNNAVWEVEPSDILYSEKHLLVDHFSLHHGSQYINIDGKASERQNDSIVVDLNGVEVAYILNLVNFHAVEFSGEASGRAYASALFATPKAGARLQVDHFKFERGRMGVLSAAADWNSGEKQIDIHAIANDGPDAMTYIDGYVSPERNFIDLGIRAEGTHIDFMHNFTKSFISSITGQADGDLRLAGPLDNINLTGRLVVDGQAAITPLGTTYTLQRDTVSMVPDEIELRNMQLKDRDGHKASLYGGIHHKHLTSLSYDLYVKADNLLAYDFKDFGESSFYGTVYASGDVAIHGQSGEVVIDCNVTPQANTVFTYNATMRDEIGSQEFITWSSSDASVQAGLSPTAVPGQASQSSDIYINFLINTTPDAAMRLLMDEATGDYITLNGQGVIRATFYNKGPFNMYGTYTVERGTYGITIQNIIKKNFSFNSGGTIAFGGDPYNAALNLQAVNTVSGVSLSDLQLGNTFSSNTIRVNCLMNIGGQPAAPEVTFDLEMPTVNADEQQMVRSVINGQQEMNQQVLYLLAIGKFYNQGVNNAGAEQTDQTSLAMQSFLSGTLSSQLNSLLGQVIKNDNWNFGANISTGNEGWHNAEYEGLVSGRLLNNRLLLNGQFGYRDNATQASPSFIGDFDIQYLLLPNGNLSVKMYNQTNDRYFTRSSLNTQGLGLIMKKDFNSLGDLLGRRQKK